MCWSPFKTQLLFILFNLLFFIFHVIYSPTTELGVGLTDKRSTTWHKQGTRYLTYCITILFLYINKYRKTGRSVCGLQPKITSQITIMLNSLFLALTFNYFYKLFSRCMKSGINFFFYPDFTKFSI